MFTFNGDRGDREQVRPYLDQYEKLRAAGAVYNDDFRGKIDGVAGSDDESTAIYMLSCLWQIEGEREEIAHAMNDGYQKVSAGKPNTRKRFAQVIVYRPDHYVGGTGIINRYDDARLVFDVDGNPFALIPKGKQKGYDLRGAEILAKSMAAA